MASRSGVVRSSAIALLAAAWLPAGCGGQEVTPSPGPSEGGHPGTARAPAMIRERCRQVGAAKRVTVRCPSRLPRAGPRGGLAGLSIEGDGDFGSGRCDWLMGVRYARASGKRPGAVHHLLVGGRCRPFPLGEGEGRWPRSVKGIEPSLALVGRGSLSVGDPPGTPFPRVRPRLIGRARVGDEPALMLSFAPYPASGTVHGGHQALVFNSDGDGQTVSMHFTGGSREHRLRLLTDVARSMTRDAG